MQPKNREEKKKKGKMGEQKEQQKNELQEGRVNKRYRDRKDIERVGGHRKTHY